MMIISDNGKQMIKKKYDSRLWSVYSGVIAVFIAHTITNDVPIYFIVLQIFICIVIISTEVFKAVCDYRSKKLNDELEDTRIQELITAKAIIEVIKSTQGFNFTIDNKNSQNN